MESLAAIPEQPAVAGRGVDLADDRPTARRVERVVVIGAGRAAVQVLDILSRCPGQRPVALLDDAAELHGRTMFGVPVVGSVDHVTSLIAAGTADAAVIASGSPERRAALWDSLGTIGVRFTNVVDPSVLIGLGASLGVGNVLGPGCRIGPCTRLGDNTMLSSFVNLEHDNSLGSHTTSGPNVHTSGSVSIGARVRLGTGITVEPSVRIGDDSIVASGLAVTVSVPAGSAVKTRTLPVVAPRKSPGYQQVVSS